MRILRALAWILPIRVAFGMTRGAMRRTRDDRENAGLRQFLLGLAPNDSGCRFWIQGGLPKVILSGGSYELLFRFKDAYVLNMDHPLADLPVPEWRKRVLAAAKDVGVEVLPLSERALQEAMRAAGSLRPCLVIREGYEAVFTLGDNHYLSGYDRQEDPPLYFLCQLPGPASSVPEARESLKPQSVREALANGVRVERQGDLFFIATSMSDADVRRSGGLWWGATSNPSTTPLYGTAHTATRVAQLPSRVMLASGIVRHEPAIIGDTRNADHAPLVLGHPDWWLVARNTVPAAAKLPEPKAPDTAKHSAGEETLFVDVSQFSAQGAPPFSDPFWAYT